MENHTLRHHGREFWHTETNRETFVGSLRVKRFSSVMLAAIFVAIILLPALSAAETLPLEGYDTGFFHIDKPRGWQVVTAGQCGSLAFLIRDPSQPNRQIFHFGEVGPVYMTERQKQIDTQYMQMGGYPVQWIEMPVVSPLTPTNFLAQFYQIVRTRVAQSFMPQCPQLEGFTVISTTPQQSPIQGGATELVRALFQQDNTICEGLFVATVAPMTPFTGNPGGGIGYGFLVTGITAPHKEFKALQGSLTRSVSSFDISRQYMNQCMQQQAATYAGIMRAGRTLSETSDMIMRGWEERNRSQDIIAEKRSDAILGRERLYNPEDGQVYEFDNGFYGTYNLHRDQYQMNNLEPLPDGSYDLWTAATLDGPRNLH